MSVTIGVIREPGNEKRVALVPEVVQRLIRMKLNVLMESGAGKSAFYEDTEFAQAGARITGQRNEVLSGSDIIASVQPPLPQDVRNMREGMQLVGFIYPSRNTESVAAMSARGMTVFALELLPRITRAQGMDALSSQSTVAGYKAALMAADYSPKLLPMLTTAAGTVRPASVLVLGAGVAGLMAVATAKRLGANVVAYDVRRAAGEQVRSLGAKFLELQIDAEGSGGYARELTPEEKAMEQQMVEKALSDADAVITTANVPGRRAPLLISKEMVSKMKAGSVIIDMAAESGGNCELTRPGETVVSGDVTIIGPVNLPGEIPFHASQMYARNILSFLQLLVDKDGNPVSDLSDEILKGCMLMQKGTVVHQGTKELLEAKR